MKNLRIIIAVIALVFSHIAVAKASLSQQSWQQWLQQFKQEAVADGIDPIFFDDVFRGVKPDKRTVSLDRRQPEKRLTFLKYRKTRGDNYRILLGKKEYKKNITTLNAVEQDYGVDACFIVSLWGIESSYGRYMGKFSVIKSLATLAYDGRRGPFFRKQLLYALHILAGGHVTKKEFVGEWAGGTGQPQFLPSSWFDYAVDYNHDGFKDIWKTRSDVFASIANYLVGKGWKQGQPWAYEVELPHQFDQGLLGKKNTKTVRDWIALGVSPTVGRYAGDEHLDASIIQPYGGPALMIFNNFRVLMRYNNSTYYAGTVGFMADKICKRS